MVVRTNVFPKNVPDAIITTFVFVIIPIVYYFELFIVLPKYYPLWSCWYLFHFTIGTFILWNICSNLIAIIMCDTSIKGRLFPSNLEPNWKFCSVCESVVPPRSWHCKVCNICILKRDHHCKFTSCCVGHDNHRYFMLFVFYLFIATIYATCYNVCFILDFVEFESWVTVFKVIFPLATLFLNFSISQIYLSLVLLICITSLFTAVLLFFHARLISRGLTTHERKRISGEYDLGIKLNVVAVLGDRWYLVWLSPFVESKLPFSGLDWKKSQSIKFK